MVQGYLRNYLMQVSSSKRNVYTGICLAVIATIIWSGNFIVARGVSKQVSPISLAFYRWAIASVVLIPFAVKQFKKDWPVIKASWHYLFWVSLTGIALFNTFVYVGAHYTSGINLALISTTSSPIMAVILARVFLKEKIGGLKVIGIMLCIIGVLFLLSRGNFKNLFTFQFTGGDGWILLAALSFAIYNTLVKKKPSAISPISFLFAIFSLGTLLLLPFFVWENINSIPIVWTPGLWITILYLGIGASVISFLIWNIAIHRLGSGRTALFGNLIPIFSSIEAVLFLHEQFNWVHITSMGLVFLGILLANIRSSV